MSLEEKAVFMFADLRLTSVMLIYLPSTYLGMAH